MSFVSLISSRLCWIQFSLRKRKRKKKRKEKEKRGRRGAAAGGGVRSLAKGPFRPVIQLTEYRAFPVTRTVNLNSPCRAACFHVAAAEWGHSALMSH